MPFAAILMANTALLWSFLAVTGYAFCYLGYALALYRWQGSCFVLLVIYSALDA